MKKLLKKFRSVQTRHGFYSVGMIAVVIVIAVVVNLIVGQLPEKWKQVDVSNKNIYGVSKTSRKLLKNLGHKIKFTVYADKSTTDERIKTFLDRYTALTDQIGVEWINPVDHPQALQENKDAQSSSIVVSCEDTGKSVTVPFSDIIVQDYSSYYTSGSTSESEFDADGQLTSAINQVTTDVSKKLYYTTGHGETTLSTEMTDELEGSSVTTEELNLLMVKEMPADCDLLLIDAPSGDFSEQEKTMLLEYLSGGGKVIYVMGDAFPEISASGDLGDGLENNMVLLVNSAGFTVKEDLGDTLTVDEVMTTSPDGYVVTENEQTQGEYTLAAVAEEGEAKLTVIASESMINSQITDYFSNLDNKRLFVNMVLNNFDDVENLSIDPKSLSVEMNTVQHAGSISTALIFGVPAVVLIGGFVIWMKRRKA